MGKRVNRIGEARKKEGDNMTSEQERKAIRRASAQERLAAEIGMELDAEVVRLVIKNWDTRRTGMRERLPGDRHR